MTANSKLATICGKFSSWYATLYKNIWVCERDPEFLLAGEWLLFCSCQHYYMAKSESLVFSRICFRWLVVREDVVSGGGRRCWGVVQVFCRSRPFWCGALYLPLSLPAHSIHYMQSCFAERQSRGTQLFFSETKPYAVSEEIKRKRLPGRVFFFLFSFFFSLHSASYYFLF